MLLGVPTLGRRGLSEIVSPHFGRAPTFTIVDSESGSVEVMDNTSEHRGGRGKPPEALVQCNINVMLCSGLGPRAIHMFESYGIRVFVGASGTVQDSINSWKRGILQEATDENACKEHRH
jgi:predicted Fe-Mo cluster-binding NifX family protein